MASTMVPALAVCGSSSGTGNSTAGAPAESQTGEITAAQEVEIRSQGETRAEANVESRAEAPALPDTIKVMATNENYVTLSGRFTEDAGVKVELLSMSSGEVLSELYAEGGTLSVDLWFGGDVDAPMSTKDDGLLEQVIFGTSGDLAEDLKDPEGCRYSRGITIIGFLLGDGLMEELNIEAPASWNDLLKVEYEGEIIVSNSAVSGTNYAVVNVLLQVKGGEDDWSYFEGLNKNIAYYARRGSDPKNKMTTDEYAIGITYIDGTIGSLLGKYDMSIAYPTGGTPWIPGEVAALKNVENTDAAEYFIEWLFSGDGNLQMLAEVDQENSVKAIKPSLEGLDLGYNTGMLMKEDLPLFSKKRTEILEHFEVLMGNEATDE